MKAQSKPIFDRFIEKVDISGDCWIWMGSCGKPGYGHIKLPGLNKTIDSHRLSFELFIGEIVYGLDIMHSCDNRKCVNPGHLSQGTRRENILDMYRKGRGQYGKA